MKTLKHKLLSIPGKEVELSEEYAQTADSIIKDLKALKSKEGINQVLNVYGYAWDTTMHDFAMGILESSEDSSYHKRSIDRIYIKLGKEAIEKDTELGLGKLKEEYQRKKNLLGLSNSIRYGRLNTALNIITNDAETEWKRKSEGKK